MDDRFIYERLKALSGGVEREQYRDISKAFGEVVTYNKKALQELKDQLDRQIKDISERYYLYGAVTSENDAPIVNDFLFPMAESKAPDSIATIFCPCSFEEMENIFSSPQELLVEADEGIVEIRAQIRPCGRYLDKVERLKRVYFENGIYWRNPFLPYVYRFGDVYSSDFDPESKIQSIRFKNRETIIRSDLIPLWNVEEMKNKCTIFPVPAIDEQNYKHTLRLPFLQDGYALSMEEGIKNVYFADENLVLISEEKQQREFDLYRIAMKRNIPVPHYPLTTNFRHMRHVDRQADLSVRRLRTRAEISRMITSYEAADDLEFVGITEGRSGEIKNLTKQYAYEPPGQEALMLSFQVKKASFVTKDAVSFLVSEVQDIFPHMLVTGELITKNP